MVVYAAVVAIGVGVEVAIERAAAGGEPPGLLGWGMVLLIGGFFVVGWGRVGWSSPDPAIRRVRPAKIAVAAVAVAACSVDIPVPLAASLIALAWVGLVVVEMRLGLMPGWPGRGYGLRRRRRSMRAPTVRTCVRPRPSDWADGALAARGRRVRRVRLLVSTARFVAQDWLASNHFRPRKWCCREGVRSAARGRW